MGRRPNLYITPPGKRSNMPAEHPPWMSRMYFPIQKNTDYFLSTGSILYVESSKILVIWVLGTYTPTCFFCLRWCFTNSTVGFITINYTTICYPQKANIAPENGWLVDYFPFGFRPIGSKMFVLGRAIDLYGKSLYKSIYKPYSSWLFMDL